MCIRDRNYPYHEPEEPQTKEQLWAKLVEQNKKLSPDDSDARRKLYNHCCMFGTAKDAVDLFEEIQGVPMADSSYRDAIARYLYLGEQEKALQTAERLAASRLWAVAGPTPVSYTHLNSRPPFSNIPVVQFWPQWSKVCRPRKVIL